MVVFFPLGLIVLDMWFFIVCCCFGFVLIDFVCLIVAGSCSTSGDYFCCWFELRVFFWLFGLLLCLVYCIWFSVWAFVSLRLYVIQLLFVVGLF